MVHAVTLIDDEGEPDTALAYDPDDEGPAGSSLAQIKSDVKKKVDEATKLRHPGLPDYVLLFRKHIEAAEAASIEKRTKMSKKQTRDRFSLFLAVTNTGIERDGVPVENAKGKPVTFRDPELLAALEAKTASECVVQFLQENDGWIIALADKVATAAGFGADIEEVTDPT